MTTNELIAELKRLDPSGEGEVEVPVGSYTQVYPSAYLKPYKVSQSPHYTGNDKIKGVRIWVSFPKGYRISKLKEVA